MRHSFFFLFLIILSSCVSGIGVSPGRYTVDFEPYLQEDFSFAISNRDGMDYTVQISVGGDLAEYVTLSRDEFFIKNGEYEQFTASLRLPATIEVPGRHVLSFYAVQISTQTGGIGARAGIVPQIFIDVPYPGRYVELAGFTVAEGKGGVNEGEDTPVVFTLKSRGEQWVRDTSATLTYKNAEGETLQTIVVEGIAIEPGMTYTHQASFSTHDDPASDYVATLLYSYDDRELKAERQFRVGAFDISLERYDKNVTKGGIAQFTFDVRNLWKGSVYAEGTLIVPGLSPTTSARSTLVDFEKKTFSTYVDTASLSPGQINATLRLWAEKVTKGPADNTVSKDFPITFTLAEPKVAAPVKERAGFLSGVSSLYLILVALIVLLVVNSFFLMRTFSKKGKRK